MKNNTEIEHKGVVHSVDKGTVTVRIIAHSACSSCHAAGVCGSSGSVEKYFHVSYSQEIAPGQEVKIITSLGMGFKALFYGYIAPFIVLLFTAIILSVIGADELLTGGLSLGSVALYYLVFYHLRNRVEKKILFKLIPA